MRSRPILRYERAEAHPAEDGPSPDGERLTAEGLAAVAPIGEEASLSPDTPRIPHAIAEAAYDDLPPMKEAPAQAAHEGTLASSLRC